VASPSGRSTADRSCLRAPVDERIPVGASRPVRCPREAQHGVVDATGAGLTLIVLVGIFIVLGALAGDQVALATSGAIVGGTLGLPMAFAAIYLRYKNL
jgi:hypothetical protein